MRFPLITDYIDSIKFSENNFAKFTDLQPMVDDNGTPIYIRENSCVLFKMKDIVSNKIYFVKCFLEDQAGRNEWYNNIVQSNLFYPQHESYYLPDELFVDTEVSESEEFPVFIYPWSDRICLVDYIKANIDDKTKLNHLAFRFSQILKWTKDNNYHWSDLDVNKVFVRSDGNLTFSDIDDILTTNNSDDKEVERLSDISLTMLLLSLKSIAINPSLFEYNNLKSHLLFSNADLDNLTKNEIFRQLMQLEDNEVKTLIGYLLICLNFNSNNGINSNIFYLRPVFDSEFEELQYYAENGDDSKQVELARKYFAQDNYEEAFKWYERAAHQGNPDGINGMGCCYKCGYYVDKDEKYAVQLFSEAADQGSLKALHNLANAYYRGEGIELDSDKADLLYRKLAEKGDAHSQFMVGQRLMHNQLGMISWHIVSKRDTKEAFSWFEKSAKQGFSLSQKKLGMFYESGTDPCIRNINKALYWYKKAADQGDNDAVLALGRLYANGIDEQNPDPKTAYKYFMQAAENGHPEAQYRVGVALYYGKGVDINKETALSWLEASAKQRYEAAEKLLFQLKSEEETDYKTSTEATEEEIANANMDSFGVLYSADGKKLLNYGVDDITNDQSFGALKQQSLRKYIVPEGVEIICDEAFSECESLEEIILPSSIKMIGNMAFYNCFNLESLVVPEGVKSIDYLTFHGCTSLNNLVLPKSLEEIDTSALVGVQEIVSNSSNYVVKSGCLFSPDYKTLIFFFNNGRTSFVIPDGTERIGSEAFAQSSLRNIFIPDSVLYIEESAFAACRYLQNIDLPSSIITIRSAAFYQCESLYNLKLPKQIKCIEPQTFEGCRNLTYVTIPDSVEVIGHSAFAMTNIKSISLPNNLKTLYGMAFALAPIIHIESHSEDIIVDNMTIFSADRKELIQYYGKEKRVEVPNTVVKIADFAFACAYSIKELIIPDSVEEIGNCFLDEVLPDKILVPSKLKDLVEQKTESLYHKHIFVTE